jgi:hypothetical protein
MLQVVVITGLQVLLRGGEGAEGVLAVFEVAGLKDGDGKKFSKK